MPSLIVYFTPTVPAPAFGYYVKYRKQGETLFKHVSTASSPLEIPVDSTGIYEGVVIARCIDSMSPPVPWTAKVCPPMAINFDIRNHPGDITKADVTASASGGTAPYTFTWSNGQSGDTATGLTKTQTYQVTVTDAGGCATTQNITPNISILSGLNVEVMYFASPSNDPNDPFNERPCTKGHTCNRARFELRANNQFLGIANLNNFNGTNANDGTIDDKNYPPNYPNYSNPTQYDRYYIKEITPAEAELIADDDGRIFITLVWTGIDPSGPHSDACWIRIKKQDGTQLLSTCVDAFNGYDFDPYAV